MRIPHRVVVLLAAYLAAGCEDENAPATLGAPLPVWEDLRIGVLEGEAELQFDKIATVAVDEDGIIYVGQMMQGIRMFSSDGTYLRTLGAPGDGPGEFSGYSDFFFAADTVLVRDARDRLHAFMPSGEFLSTHSYVGSHSPFAAGGDGFIVRWLEDGTIDPRGMRRPLLRVAWTARPDLYAGRARLETGVLVPVAEHPDNPFAITPTGGLSRLPYGIEGQAVTDVHGRTYVHSGSEYRISVIDWTGDTVRTIEQVVDPTPVPDELLALPDRPSGPTAEFRDLSLGLGFIPILGHLVVSSHGMILVNRPDLEPIPALAKGAEPTYWDLYDANGGVIGLIELEPRVVPRALTSEYIVATARDAFDVEYVVRLRWR